jgi:RecA/RadA recombinase
MLTTDESSINKEKSSDIIFKSAAKVSVEEQKRERLSTGSKNIDFLLDGGLECGAITQFYGASKVGKTHLSHSLCAVLPLHYSSIYIDTQGGFSSMKIKSIAQTRGLNSSKILENITVAKANTTSEQEQCIESIKIKIKSGSNIKLLILDSMTHLYKVEYPERSQLTVRQSKISKYLHLLLQIAQTNDIAVVITNQVHSNPQPYSGSNKLQPIGGNILSYPCKYIINIESWGDPYRRAVLEKHPYRPHLSVPLMIDDRGFSDRDPFLSQRSR